MTQHKRILLTAWLLGAVVGMMQLLAPHGLIAADPEKGASNMGYIDAHLHVWTDDTTRYPLAPGWKIEDLTPRRFTPEDLFEQAKPAGVTRFVLVQMSCYSPRDKTRGIGNRFDNS